LIEESKHNQFLETISYTCSQFLPCIPFRSLQFDRIC